MGRWIKPEVFPIFGAVGTVVGICSMQLIRNITTNPEVRAAGILDNFSEGEKYAQHGLRKYVRGRRPEVMPNVNKYFTQ
ncbi:hypothetical protein Leryth_018005 [Lithospermum erythrorhizon]|nr:hypothetical protein Leryth_018005 [Lithospermum erythrorhizon]